MKAYNLENLMEEPVVLYHDAKPKILPAKDLQEKAKWILLRFDIAPLDERRDLREAFLVEQLEEVQKAETERCAKLAEQVTWEQYSDCVTAQIAAAIRE